jgi:hypothetical protein
MMFSVRRRVMVTFGIPLKATKSPAEWSALCRLLSDTIRSVYNQTDQSFRIIVACDRMPELDFATDDRLELLQIALPTPKDHDGGDNDAGAKRWEIARRFLLDGGGYLMFLDADDLVSNRLIAFVRKTRHDSGYVFEQGYGMDAASRKVLPIPQPGVTDRMFHQMCGSSIVVRFAPGDLSSSTEEQPRFNRLMRGGHTTVAKAAEEEGRPMLSVPFRAAIYVVGTNVSQSDVRSLEDPGFGVERDNWKRTLAMSGFDVSRIADEFGLNYRPRAAPPKGSYLKTLFGRWRQRIDRQSQS